MNSKEKSSHNIINVQEMKTEEILHKKNNKKKKKKKKKKVYGNIEKNTVKIYN